MENNIEKSGVDYIEFEGRKYILGSSLFSALNKSGGRNICSICGKHTNSIAIDSENNIYCGECSKKTDKKIKAVFDMGYGYISRKQPLHTLK